MQSNEQAGQIDHLLSCLYDGITNSAGFHSFNAELAVIFKLNGVMLIALHLTTYDIKALWLYGIEPQWLECGTQNFAPQNILAAHINTAPKAQFYANNLDISAGQFDLDRPFFKELLLPQGGAFAVSALLLKDGDWLTLIIAQRRPDQAPFECAELDLLNRLVPHMQRAIQMRRRFVGLELGEQMLSGWLDMLRMPILLLDESGCVAYQNQRAEDLFKNCTALSVKDRHILIGNPTESRQLNLAITKVIAAQWHTASEVSAGVQISRHRQFPLMALITTLCQSNTARSGAMLFIFDPEQAPRVTRTALRKLFRFSESEATLAVGLCAGFSLETMAIKRDVSINTLKSQLKSLFGKTGVNRQSDLVAMMLTSPAYFLSLQGESDEVV